MVHRSRVVFLLVFSDCLEMVEKGGDVLKIVESEILFYLL